MFLAAWQPLPSRSLKNNIRMFFFRLYWSNVEVQFKYDKFLSKELWTFNFVKHFKLDWKTRIYAFCCENISVLNYAFFGVTFWTQIFIRVKNWHFETLSTWTKNLITLITKYWWKFHFVISNWPKLRDGVSVCIFSSNHCDFRQEVNWPGHVWRKASSAELPYECSIEENHHQVFRIWLCGKKIQKIGARMNFELDLVQWWFHYDTVSANVIIWVLQMGESESGQMVSEKVKLA